jgi:hypothetical protein
MSGGPDPSDMSAVAYLFICGIYLRDRHDQLARWMLAISAVLLAVFAEMKGDIPVGEWLGLLLAAPLVPLDQPLFY